MEDSMSTSKEEISTDYIKEAATFFIMMITTWVIKSSNTRERNEWAEILWGQLDQVELNYTEEHKKIFYKILKESDVIKNFINVI